MLKKLRVFPLQVLIETLWNVKVENAYADFAKQIVLIETLWNVKFSASVHYRQIIRVLIETLWNVKLLEEVKKQIPVVCFNRNIVECKVSLKRSSSSNGLVLIETLWNVK